MIQWPARGGPSRAAWRYVNLFGKFCQLFYVNRTNVRNPERLGLHNTFTFSSSIGGVYITTLREQMFGGLHNNLTCVNLL